jgi:Contractile injection system tube protein
MPLEKLTIEIEKGGTIEARFNPERYTVSKSVQIAEIGLLGLDSPVQQYVRGQTEKITLELFFDSTEFGMVDDVKDVRDYTGPLYRLLKVRSDTHAPPRFKLKWGDAGKLLSHGTSIDPWCLLETISQEFTLFSPGGVPLRAKVNLTLREAWTIEQQLAETPRRSGDRTHVRVLESGQTLSDLAWKEYGDAALWRPIAEANGVQNPRTVAAGTRLEIPRLEESR